MYYDRNRLSNDETRLSDYYFTDYIRCLNSLINKSNKRYKDIINIIREWNKDDIVRTEIIDKAKNKSLLLKMLKRNNIILLVNYFKIIQIKRNMIYKFKIKLKRILGKKEYKN